MLLLLFFPLIFSCFSCFSGFSFSGFSGSGSSSAGSASLFALLRVRVPICVLGTVSSVTESVLSVRSFWRLVELLRDKGARAGGSSSML